MVLINSWGRIIKLIIMKKSLAQSGHSVPTRRSPSPRRNSPSVLLEPPQSSGPPVKYLLQNNIKLNMGVGGDRGQAQIEMIGGLLSACTIFEELQIDISEPSLLRELSKGVVLLYCESPHIMQIKENELYIFFEGQGFQYMQNTFSSQFSKRFNIYQNNEYVMLHKITTNQYFLSLPEINARYHATRKKYQLMVDQNTLIGKISEELFCRLFMPKIIQRQKISVAFLKKVGIFSGLPHSFFGELGQFVTAEEVAAEQMVIQRGERSKYVYFVRSGEVEVKSYPEIKGKIGSNYYVAPGRPYHSQKLGEFDSFGMEELEMVENAVDKQMVCLKDSKLYKIEKRLLAIIITSFEMQFKQKSKVWSEVNINSQIKGQNYCTPEQSLLLKNAERIRTSERKARDLKLRYYATSKKPVREGNQTAEKNRGDNGKQPVEEKPLEKEYTVTNSRVMSPDEKRRMTKTTDGRFRSTSIMKCINTFGGTFNGGFNTGEENKMETIKKLNRNRLSDQEDRFVNHFQLLTLDEGENLSSPPILRQSNAFEYRDKMETIKFTRSLSREARQTQTSKFVPRLSSRVQDSRYSERNNADLIGFYLDKKIKNEIVKKADKVVSMNKNARLTENRNIKRLFTSRDYKMSGLSQADKKTIASDIVERMSNMRGNPLLLQIESQRRKVERQMKERERKTKPVENLHKKIKKEDLHIVIKNNADQ